MSLIRAIVVGTLQVLGFAVKDFREILRQPRLLAALGLGPFLILFLFGMSFRNQFHRFDAVVSVPASGVFPNDLSVYQSELGEIFNVTNVFTSRDEALGYVRSRKAEVAIVLDEDMEQKLQAGEQAQVKLYFNEIDPQRAGWLQHFARAETADMNRRLVTIALRSRAPEIAQIQAVARQAEQRLNDPLLERNPGLAEARNQVRRIASDLEALQQRNPERLLSPLTVELQNLAPIEPTSVAFYAPAVLALLVQHLAMTMASLSIVRERTLGMFELFRVAPLMTLPMVLGKYLGYALLSALVALVLVGLQLYVLGVPLIGALDQFVLLLTLLMLASLGLGMAISAIAKSETQVVQLGMLVLLASVFFSGLALPHEQFIEPAQVLSYVLPVTHGTAGLKDIMLRGAHPATLSILVLGALAAVLYLAALLGVRNQLKSV